MKCPKCGSTNTLQLKADLGENKSGHVCECGYQWVHEVKSLFHRLKECKTPEEMADLFVWQNCFGIWGSYLCYGRFADRNNAHNATVEVLKGEF